MKQGVPPHYCQAEGKSRFPTCPWLLLGGRNGGGSDSLSLLGTVGFPDPHGVSTNTRVGGGGLIPMGQWLDTSPVLRGMEEERCLSDRVGIPGSHTISIDIIDDASLPAVRREGPYLVFSVG